MEPTIGKRHRPTYDHETRAWAVAEVQSGRNTQRDVARVVGCTVRQLRRWLCQADIDAGRRPGLTIPERRELYLLRRANQRLQNRVSLLEEARDFFATGTR
jgi:transposase-like protein